MAIRQENISNILTGLPQFRGLNDLALRFISSVAQVVTVKRHERIIRCDSQADCFVVVVQGHVEVSLSADTGFHKVIEFAAAGDQIGEAMMFVDGRHLIDAKAITPVTYLWLSKSNCVQAIALDSQFAVQLIEVLSGRFVRLLADIKATNCLTARQRIYQFLLSEPRQGNTVRLSVTKGMIASKLGIAKETLSRELHRLSADGLIKVQGSTIEILDGAGAFSAIRLS